MKSTKLKAICAIIVTICWIQSYSQDKLYSREQREYIASKILDLKACEKSSVYKDSIIFCLDSAYKTQKTEIKTLEIISLQKDTLSNFYKNNEIYYKDELYKEVKKSKKNQLINRCINVSLLLIIIALAIN